MRLFNKFAWEKVPDDDKDLLEDYQLEMEAQGKAEKSIYQYVTDIKGFYCWKVEGLHNKLTLELKRKNFRNFFLTVQKEGASNARINRLQSSLRNLLEYAVTEDDYDYDINEMAHIKGLQKEEVRKIVFLTDHQVNQLIDYLVRHEQYQKALFVSLAYDSCGRRNELAQVKKDGFVDSHQTNTVKGKRSKEFQLLYFNRTRQLAKIYLQKRGEDDVESLWITGKGDKKRAVSYATLYAWVEGFRSILLDLTGEEINLNVHSFRHSGLEAYTNGEHYVLKEMGKDSLPLDVAQLIAHHSDISTTQSYLKDHSDEKLADAFGLTL